MLFVYVVGCPGLLITMRGVGPWIMGLAFSASPTAPFLAAATCFFLAAAIVSDRFGGPVNGSVSQVGKAVNN